MTEKKATTAIILSIIAILISAVAMTVTFIHSDSKESESLDTQYVLYLGTNDKDTNQPVFTPEKAKKEAEKILIDHFGGYTIQEASGGWVDEDKEYQEYTLVIHLSDTDIEQVHSAADEMVKVFRQSAVLIQTNQTVTEFYEGKKQAE